MSEHKRSPALLETLCTSTTYVFSQPLALEGGDGESGNEVRSLKVEV